MSTDNQVDGGGGDDEAGVTFSVTIENGETVVTMRGDRDTAVIVRSEMGERIYLPPEDFEREAKGGDGPSAEDSSPYRGAESASPYRGAESSNPYQGAESSTPYRGIESDSPYQAARQELPTEGMISTADGYRIRHPEPADDVRLLR
ncbi:MAG: hypothetical protein ABEI27_06065 [Halobellus sp.]|uniref:DUF7510 family protein n=1 Tax=Halobellus sp. TaxID=1979212 RepID=UPI0035D516F9